MIQICSRQTRTKRFVTRTGFHLFIVLMGLLPVVLGCAQDKADQIKPRQQPPVQTRTGGVFSTGNYRAIVIAELNNDGNPDIIAGSSLPGTVALWYGDGRGGLSEPQFLPFKGDVRSVAVADIDGDGLKDIICSAQRESAGILVWKNKGNFNWKRAKGPVQAGNYEGLAVVDLDKDGFVDIVAANATSDSQGGIQIWFGDGKGNWQGKSGPTVKGRYMNVAPADINEDGLTDLVGAGWGTYGALNIWFGDGTGGWSSRATIRRGSYYGATLTDFNRDGHLDILAATYKNGLQIFWGDGKGNFNKGVGPTEKGSFWSILVTDIDGDGAEDILASSLDASGLAAWKKKDAKTWMSITDRFPATGTYYGIAKGDLNKDGRDDLGAASYGEGIKVWLGKGGQPVSLGRGRKARELPGETFSFLSDIKENSVFTTVAGVPEYKIGPGDVLEITFWRGTEGKREEIRVRTDGRISFGFVEDLDVRGLTASQLDKILTGKLGEFIKQPRIDVVVKEFKSKSVTLVGAIMSSPYFRSGPGTYNLTGKTDILKMVSSAGGPTRDANLSRVTVRRKNGRAFTVDMYKILTQGDQSQNIVLDDGDLVMVPAISKEENRVYIFGEVKKPGVYTFTGEGMRLFDIVSEAGGTTVFAKKSSTKIVRGDIARPEVISADLKKLVEEGDISQNVTLANGDLVYVPRSFIGDINRFIKQVTPLMRLIIYPAQVINEYGTAGEWLNINKRP